MVSDGAGEQGRTDRGAWAAWLDGFATQADPLGVRGLLARSADALAQARTPAGAIRALADALACERAERMNQADSLGGLLEQWASTLQVIAPILPDTPPPDYPSLGPYPGRQAQLRTLADRIDAYQAALAGHLDSVTELSETCIAHLQRELGDQPVGSADPEWMSRRWSAIAESEYERWLASPETQRRIAALVNAWSRLIEGLRSLADDALEALGLPSGRGMDDIAAELQRQRRRQRQETAALRAEIAELREAIENRDTSTTPPT